MKKICLILLAFIFYVSKSQHLNAQSIDSVKLTVGTPNSTLYVAGMMPQFNLSSVNILSLNDANNTQVLSLYFKGCPFHNNLVYYDTNIIIKAPYPFALKIYTIWDTSYVCPYPTFSLTVDSAYIASVQTNIHEMLYEQSDFKIYPSPVSEIMNVSLSQNFYTNEGNLAISVYDLLGNVIQNSTLTSQHSQIDLSRLRKGIYFVRVGNVSRKFVKQ